MVVPQYLYCSDTCKPNPSGLISVQHRNRICAPGLRSVKSHEVRRLGDVVEYVVDVPGRPGATTPRGLWEPRGRGTGQGRCGGAARGHDLDERLAGEDPGAVDAGHLGRSQDFGVPATLFGDLDGFLLLWGFVLLVLISVDDGQDSDLPLLVVVLQVLGSASSGCATAGPR